VVAGNLAKTRHLIINADGYGFTAGVTRAIEECVDFGTVRSLSANVNFPSATRLPDLVRAHPDLSVGCHVNPIVGPPLLPASKIPTLVDDNGEFFYRSFTGRFLRGRIRLADLEVEMLAQVERTRELAGEAFSHIDFHMGLHRLPRLYDLFLKVVRASGVKRLRTHRYRVGMESRRPLLRHLRHVAFPPSRTVRFFWNLWLRRRALAMGLVAPDRRVEITHLGSAPGAISVERYVTMLRNLPRGFNEFVAHPGYVDDELARWSTYLEARVLERKVLLSPTFRQALGASDVRLAGYRDIPVN
jgi:predicted glycoside hydrolase/deacetylase ChbG (UPF0249 family)